MLGTPPENASAASRQMDKRSAESKDILQAGFPSEWREKRKGGPEGPPELSVKSQCNFEYGPPLRGARRRPLAFLDLPPVQWSKPRRRTFRALDIRGAGYRRRLEQEYTDTVRMVKQLGPDFNVNY
jgi:hypothetical protein